MGSPYRLQLHLLELWGFPSGFRTFPASILKKDLKKILNHCPEAAEIHRQPQSQLLRAGVKPSVALAILGGECD